MSESAPYVPEDFAEFWQEAVAEAASVKLDCHRSFTNDFDCRGFVIETLDFATVGGRRLYGWIACPPAARRRPAFLWIPPYGRESLLPNEYGTREGFVSLSFNFHGHEAFHQEKYTQERGYFSEGAGSPETWIFRRMLQDTLIAARILQAQVEVDEDRIGAMGMSQGGGMAIWMGAWSPIIKAVCADMPFLGGMNRTLAAPVHRYPLKELTDFMETIPVGEARVLNTVSYFDTINQATCCVVPTQVSLGLKDPASRPDIVRAVFDALPGKKQLRSYEGGHDWDARMIENNREWLVEHLQPKNQ
ncbi:MAG: acetylxylan esterase [Fimbriimonas sp.]|nr:acetylxylan esterase [Fimbriimonas sp.]